MVVQVLLALQRHSAHVALVEHGLRCLWGLSSHADNRTALMPAVPTVLAALAANGDHAGVCQAALACLRSLAARADNRAPLGPALQQVSKEASRVCTRFRGGGGGKLWMALPLDALRSACALVSPPPVPSSRDCACTTTQLCCSRRWAHSAA
jgi:hypothetical protein